MDKIETVDVIAALKFSLSWLTNSKVWLLGLAIFLTNAIFAAAAAFVTSSLYHISLLPILTGAATSAADIRSVQIASSNPQTMLIVLIVTSAIYLLQVLIGTYIGALIARIALEKRGFTLAEFDFSRFVHYVALRIALWLSIMFPFFDKRLLAASIVCALIVVGFAVLATTHITASIIMLALLLLLVLACIVWFAIMAYSLARLFSSELLFLHQGKDVTDSLKSAVSLTEGRALNTLFSYFCVIIPIIIVFFCVFIPVYTISRHVASLSVIMRLVSLALGAFLISPMEIFAVVAVYNWLAHPTVAASEPITKAAAPVSRAVRPRSSVAVSKFKPNSKPAAKKPAPSKAKKR